MEAGVVGGVDDAHAAGADEAAHFVAADVDAGREEALADDGVARGRLAARVEGVLGPLAPQAATVGALFDVAIEAAHVLVGEEASGEVEQLVIVEAAHGAA